MPGRPFAFILLICGGWTAARFAMEMQPPSAASKMQSKSAPLAIVTASRDRVGGTMPFAILMRANSLDPTPPKMAAIRSTAPLAATKIADGFAHLPAPAPVSLTDSANRPTPPFLLNPPHTERKKAVSFYLYSFWRWPGGVGGLAPVGQYGGSQSGMIATIDSRIFSNRLANSGLSLLVRAAVVPQRTAQQEGAIGLRWKPIHKWPVTLSAEQRFYGTGSSRRAAYAAGGIDEIKLPARVKLDAYGQAGFVTGKGGGPFFDAASHAMRPVAKLGPAKIQVGAGAWAGGQRDIARLDIGPSIRSNIKIGGTQLRVDADWRFRVAGNARPASGPALTLSTSF